MRFLFPLFFISAVAIAAQSSVPAPATVPISPQEALSHRIGHDKPVYPRFALAAGVAGTVKLPVTIGPDGLVQQQGSLTGPPSLRVSAQAWIAASKFRPFLRDGQPVAVTTTLPVAFALPSGARAAHPLAALYQRNITSTIEREGRDSPPRARWSTLSPDMREWLVRYEASITAGKVPDSPLALDQIIAGETGARPFAQMPDNLTLYPVPLTLPHHRLYLLFEFSSRCAKTNCPLTLLEESPTGIHAFICRFGVDVDLHRRHDSPYPDVLVWSDSGQSGISNIAGFSYYGGQWDQLYCGTHDANEEFERDEQIAGRRGTPPPQPPLVTLCK